MRRAALNLGANPRVGIEVVRRLDAELAEGTLVGQMDTERALRRSASSRCCRRSTTPSTTGPSRPSSGCRRCGSEEVTWEEKQTRSADEGATVFCTCTRCHNRWVLR